MEVIKAYRFRIYPDAKRQKEIDESLHTAQRLYNKLLEKTIDSYKRNGNEVAASSEGDVKWQEY